MAVVGRLAPWVWLAGSWLGLAVCTPVRGEAPAGGAASLLEARLRDLPCRIAYECYVDDNWEIFVSKPDGSGATNLTRTPNVHEHYPQVSPDGTRVCFSVDEGEGRGAVRGLWVMDVDGRNRRKLVDNAREPFWSPDGRVIGFLHQEYPRFNVMDYYTRGMAFYDLAAGRVREHVNSTNLYHLYNPGFSRNGKWIVATVHAGMGESHGILLIAANGPQVFNLGVPGCRPCFSPDGRQLAWGASDHEIALAAIDLEAERPTVGPWRLRIRSAADKILHVDWSPDSRYVSFSRGPATKGDPTKPGTFAGACGIVGVYAPGWNIWVAPADRAGVIDLDQAGNEDRWLVTTNGLSNKESAWFAVPPAGAAP